MKKFKLIQRIIGIILCLNVLLLLVCPDVESLISMVGVDKFAPATNMFDEKKEFPRRIQLLPSQDENQQKYLSSSPSPTPSYTSKVDFARSFRKILARNDNQHRRQRFVTGIFPLTVSLIDNPTIKWLNLGRRNQGQRQQSTLGVLINGTTIDRSLASYDRFQWLDDFERQSQHDRYGTLSMELLAEIHIEKPGYLQILSSDGAGSSEILTRMKQNRYDAEGRGRWFWNNRPGIFNRGEGYGEEENVVNDDHNSKDQFCLLSELKALSSRETLWVTGFSITKAWGMLKNINVCTGDVGTINLRSESMMKWPNEITKIPPSVVEHESDCEDKNHVCKGPKQLKTQHQRLYDNYTRDALLVADGFLVPGKDRGGIYVVLNPGSKETEWTISLTDSTSKDRWFYHKAVWIDLTGDGRQSIMTARAKLRKTGPKNDIDGVPSTSVYNESIDDLTETSRPKNGQLVFLEMPKPHRYDEKTGTPLEKDGTMFNPFNSRHLPWKERVLVRGPDVSFAIADMDVNDDTIEVLSSQFFDEKVTLHSIQRGMIPRVTFSRIIDNKPGAAFGITLCNLNPNRVNNNLRRIVDSGCTVKFGSDENSFSNVLVTSHEASYKQFADMDDAKNVMTMKYNGSSNRKQIIGGGSLFAYRIPIGKDSWKTDTWFRTTIATGFQVRQQVWNVINPGAPGFPYVFHAHKDDKSQQKRPLIAVAGDCAESAYIFRPERTSQAENKEMDQYANYKLMCEIKCGATVGSIAVGYDDLCSIEQESGFAKIYVPCFEQDKILVFALGSGEEEIIN